MTTGPVPTLAEIEARIQAIADDPDIPYAAEAQSDEWEIYARQLAGRIRAIHNTVRSLRDSYPAGSYARNALSLVIDVTSSELVDNPTAVSRD